MNQQDSAHQDVERFMRRAETMGIDPQRVAHALHHEALRPAETQAVLEVERPSGLRVLARRFARRSAR